MSEIHPPPSAAAGPDEPPERPVEQVFTLRRLYFRLGLFLLICYSLMAACSSVGMFLDAAPGRNVLAAVAVGLFWSAWAGLSVWMLLAYFRESIVLNGDEAQFTGVIRRRTIRLAEVLRARWRRQQGVSLQLFIEGGRQTILFGNFRPEQRKQLIFYFREHLRPEVQEGWSEALERYAAEVKEKESWTAQRRLLRSLWRAALAGPVAGLACGLCLRLYAAHAGSAAPPTWTGSVLLDWTIGGTCVSALIWGSCWVLGWIFESE